MGRQQQMPPYPSCQGPQPTDYSELMNLVSAQQTTLQSQHADIKQCDAEVNFLEGHVGLPQYTPQPPQPGSQLEMVLVEARRLEEVAHRNEDELRQLAMEQSRGNNGPHQASSAALALVTGA